MKIEEQAQRHYDGRRADILEAIRAGKVSASMSGIEYYPKPWAKLDPNDAGDAYLRNAMVEWVTKHPSS